MLPPIPSQPAPARRISRQVCAYSYALGGIDYSGTRYSIVYAARIFDGDIAALDVTDPKNVVALDSVKTPLAFTHNVRVSKNQKRLFATHEKPGSGVSVFDISDPRHPRYVTTYRCSCAANGLSRTMW